MIIQRAFLAVAVFSSCLFAGGVRYQDAVFEHIDVHSNLTYGRAINYQGRRIDVRLDLYEPRGDTAAARPLVVLIHGGSFMNGSKAATLMRELGESMAKKGYVAASVDYGLGIAIFPPSKLNREFGRAICRGVADVKAAVRFLTASGFRIDPENVFLAGESAGGIIAVQYAYGDDAEMARRIDTAGCANTSTPGCGDSVKAIVNLWGGIVDSSWMAGGATPVISFHGTRDKVVPCDNGFARGNKALPISGGAAIHRIAAREGIPSELYTNDEGHGKFRTDYIVPRMTAFLYRWIREEQRTCPRDAKVVAWGEEESLFFRFEKRN